MTKHERLRQKVWFKAWCATANANYCKSTLTATSYADKCLAEFDMRFPAPKEKVKRYGDTRDFQGQDLGE